MGRGQGVRDSPELLDGEAIPRAPEEPHAGESAPGGVVGAGAGDERGREVGGAGAGARSGGSLTTVRGPPRCRRRRGDASHPRRRMISGRGDRRAGGLAFCLFFGFFFYFIFLSPPSSPLLLAVGFRICAILFGAWLVARSAVASPAALATGGATASRQWRQSPLETADRLPVCARLEGYRG
jgi:hypothetical protein